MIHKMESLSCAFLAGISLGTGHRLVFYAVYLYKCIIISRLDLELLYDIIHITEHSVQ